MLSCNSLVENEYFFKNAETKDWRIINDGVMGGESEGYFVINEDGIGIFTGNVSLENNGGFTMVFNDKIDWQVNAKQSIFLRLKGDKKSYQIRVRSEYSSYYSYVYSFETSGDWETIEIPLSEMYASWRGMRQDIPNFDQTKIIELAFLIGNKKEEKFRLELDRIEVK